MIGNKRNRVHRLEQGTTTKLSERVRAWLGQRPPLTAEEEAAEPVPAVDLAGLSQGLREWLSRPQE